MKWLIGLATDFYMRMPTRVEELAMTRQKEKENPPHDHKYAYTVSIVIMPITCRVFKQAEVG